MDVSSAVPSLPPNKTNATKAGTTTTRDVELMAAPQFTISTFSLVCADMQEKRPSFDRQSLVRERLLRPANHSSEKVSTTSIDLEHSLINERQL